MFSDIKYTKIPESGNNLIEMEEGKRAKDNKIQDTTNPLAQIATQRICNHLCCKEESNFHKLLTTTDNAIIPLVSRTAADKPFIPQSYNYIEFEENQKRAILQHSCRLTAEVYQTIFFQSSNLEPSEDDLEPSEDDLEPSKDDLELSEDDLVSNLAALTHCRFFPEVIGLRKEETDKAIKESSFLMEPLLNSYVGFLLKDAFTVVGKEFLLVRGSNPTNQKTVLLNRQAAIRELVDNENFRTQLQNMLKTYGEFEDEFASRLTPDATKLPGRIEAYLKFSMIDIPDSIGRQANTRIRENTKLLTINNYIKTTQDGFIPIFLAILALSLVEYTTSIVFPNLLASKSKAILAAFVARYIGQTGTGISALESTPNKETKIIACLLGAFIASVKAPDFFGYYKAEWNIKITLQNKMVRVAKCIRSMQFAYKLIKENGKFAERLEHFDKLEALIDSDNPKVQKMLDAIYSDSLDSESSIFNLGPVLVSWNLLLDKTVRQLVLDATIAMGEIDANITLANKVVCSTPEHSFCIPDFVDGEEAVFDVLGAHFPPVSSRSKNVAHMTAATFLTPLTILTAENGAGKTTEALKWINIPLSAQSFGIAACALGSRLSIFDNIMTSMGISDNNHESSQEAHERYAGELVEKMENHPNQKMFVLLDELFRTTHETKGASKLTELAEKLIEKSNILKAIFITHFESFAKNSSVQAARYTTRKTADGKPSGILEEGVYEFPKGTK